MNRWSLKFILYAFILSHVSIMSIMSCCWAILRIGNLRLTCFRDIIAASLHTLNNLCIFSCSLAYNDMITESVILSTLPLGFKVVCLCLSWWFLALFFLLRFIVLDIVIGVGYLWRTNISKISSLQKGCSCTADTNIWLQVQESGCILTFMQETHEWRLHLFAEGDLMILNIECGD